MEYSSPESGLYTFFWLGENVSPECLETQTRYRTTQGLQLPKVSDFRLLRLQSAPTSHPLHPMSVGLVCFDPGTVDWSNWANALLEKYPTTYLIRIRRPMSGGVGKQELTPIVSEVKNHLIGLRFTQNENARLVQWPWFNAHYFQVMCQRANRLQRERLLGPIDTICVAHEGALRFIVRESPHPECIPDENKPQGVGNQAAFAKLSLNDFARELAQFFEQHRSNLSIKSSHQLMALCSQAIPLALAQGFSSAELIGIWVLIGLVQAGQEGSLPQLDGSLCKLLDRALKCGVDRAILIALSQRFCAWDDVRLPWFSGSRPHSIWDLHAIAAITVKNPELHFNASGMMSKVHWSDQLQGLDFQLLDDAGGIEVLFGADQVDSALAQLLHARRSSQALLPAVHQVRLVPTRFYSNPLGYSNFKILNLEKPLALINRTSYGLHFSMQAWGHQRCSSVSENLPSQNSAQQAQETVMRPHGLVAECLLDDIKQAAKPDSIKWRTCINPSEGNSILPDLKNSSSAWLGAFNQSFNQSDKSLFNHLPGGAVFECTEIFPALDVKARWKLSECASMLRIQLSLDCSWSEDFLRLSAWTSLGGVAYCVRLRPAGSIEWRLRRGLDIPLEAFKPMKAVFQDTFCIPVEANLELNGLAQQHKMPLNQINLLDRQCGEIQLSCEIIYCDNSSNLKLSVMGRLSTLSLKLQETQLTLGQQNKVLSILPETLLLGVEFDAHG